MTMEAEQNLLGMAMLDTNSAIKLLEIPEDWFSINAHKLIYRSISSLAAQSLNIDVIGIGDDLFAKSESIGSLDMQYLMDLQDQTTYLKHFDNYKLGLFSSYKRNKMQSLATDLQKKIDSAEDFKETVSFLQDSVFELLTDHNTKKAEPIRYHLNELTKQMQHRMENPDIAIGLQTGYENLDRTIGGFEKEKVYIIGARPSMGKSAFGLIDVGLRISKDSEFPIVAFSLEMKGSALVSRMVCNKTSINSEKIKLASMSSEEWTSFAQVSQVIEKQNNLYIDDRGGLSSAQIRAQLKSIQIKHGGLGGIMIDHVGQMKKNDRKSETEALNQIANELLGMSKEFECPVIELAQLSRAVEQRPDKRPILSDLKQSSALEENADVVMFIYRDDYYFPEETQIPNVTELIIAKNREGECKTLYFNHQMQYSQYTPIDNFIKPDKPKKGKF